MQEYGSGHTYRAYGLDRIGGGKSSWGKTSHEYDDDSRRKSHSFPFKPNHGSNIEGLSGKKIVETAYGSAPYREEDKLWHRQTSPTKDRPHHVQQLFNNVQNEFSPQPARFPLSAPDWRHRFSQPPHSTAVNELDAGHGDHDYGHGHRHDRNGHGYDSVGKEQPHGWNRTNHLSTVEPISNIGLQDKLLSKHAHAPVPHPTRPGGGHGGSSHYSWNDHSRRHTSSEDATNPAWSTSTHFHPRSPTTGHGGYGFNDYSNRKYDGASVTSSGGWPRPNHGGNTWTTPRPIKGTPLSSTTNDISKAMDLLLTDSGRVPSSHATPNHYKEAAIPYSTRLNNYRESGEITQPERRYGSYNFMSRPPATYETYKEGARRYRGTRY